MSTKNSPRPFPHRTHLLLAVLAIGLAACSSGSTATPNATSTAPATAESMVTLTGFAFSPATLTVPAGTAVMFMNADPTEHTVTNGKDGKAADNPAFDEKVGSGMSVTVTFDKPGTYDVTCTIHSSMNMTITVQ